MDEPEHTPEFRVVICSSDKEAELKLNDFSREGFRVYQIVPRGEFKTMFIFTR